MYEGPEFRHLRYFIAIAEECHIGRAAQKLHVSQPSLSLQIQELEQAVGASLFIRGSKGAMLAAAGRAFLPFARQLLDLRERAVRAVASAHTGIDLPLRFGYSPCINHALVEEALRGFHELLPGGKIEASSDTSGQLEPMVAEGRMEAALMAMPIQNHELFSQTVCSEEMLVCLRRDDPLAKQDTISKEVVQDRLRIFFSRGTQPTYYDDLLRRFGKAGIRFEPSEFVSAPSEMQFLVKMDAGLGLLPESTPLDSELTFRKIDGFSPRTRTAFICHPAQQTPVIPMLGYRLVKLCEHIAHMRAKKKTGRHIPAAPEQQRLPFSA